MIPTDDGMSRTSEVNDFAISSFFPLKGFSGNLLKLLKKMEPDIVPRLKVNSKSVKFSRPKRNPFEFNKLFNEVNKKLHPPQEQKEEAKVKLPEIISTEKRPVVNKEANVATAKNMKRPKSKTSFENLWQIMIDNKKVCSDKVISYILCRKDSEKFIKRIWPMSSLRRLLVQPLEIEQWDLEYAF